MDALMMGIVGFQNKAYLGCTPWAVAPLLELPAQNIWCSGTSGAQSCACVAEIDVVVDP